MSKCAYPGCDHLEDSHRPYARLRDGIPSATTIASSLDSGKARSFGWAASLIAAVTAVHETPRWWNLPTHPCSHDKEGLCQACRFLRSEHDRVWSAKAALGGHVHHMALSWAKGEDVEVDATTEPYMDALEKFYKDRQPEFVHLERTVRYYHGDPCEYRGQFDFMARLRYGEGIAAFSRLGLWDIKSGGYYPVEQTLQLAGYRYATWLTRWDEKPAKEHNDGQMPEVGEAGVLMLHDDGTYELVALPADEKAFAVFLALREAWGWAKDIERWDKERIEATA